MATKEENIHKTALNRFEMVLNREKDQRKLAIEDMKFVNSPDGQWEEEAKESRNGRPRYTINRVAGAIDQLVGDQRQNRTQIKVRPVGNDADEELAEIYSGLIRNIESQSKAENAYDAAYDEAITGGYGGFRILTKFTDDSAFEQDIEIEWIPSAASSLWLDPSSHKYDKRTGNWGFVTSDMPIDEFKDKFPNATVTDFSQLEKNNSQCKDWVKGESIRVAEYWVKTPIEKNIALMTDRTVIDLDEERDVLDELKAKGITVATGIDGKPKVRKVKSHKVEMYKMNGAEILEGPKAWAGKYIPLIPVYGKITTIEGKTYIRGITRNAKDPSRIYNYATSAAIEAAALTPKDPIWITRTQAAGEHAALKTFNKKNQPFMFYTPDPEAPGVPQRTGAPSVQTALLSQVQQAAADIESTTGIHSASLGNAPQLLSERSIQSQAEKGDRGAYVFTDNLSKSIQYAGDILVDLLPRIYDTPRLVRILGVDGTSEEIEVNGFNNTVIDAQTKKPVIVNDLSRGKYDTIVETGPAYSTLKHETAEQLIDIGSAYPQLGELGLDLIVKNLPILDSDEFFKRVRKKQILAGIADPTDEEAEELELNQPQEPDPGQVALTDNVLMQNAELESKITINDQKAESETVKQYSDAVKAHETLINTLAKQKELGLPIGEIELKSLNDALALVELARDNVQV